MMAEEPECVTVFDIIPLCVGEKVELTLRGHRSMISIRGIVKALSNHAILLENRGSLTAIRLSEIKMVRKVSK